MGFDENLKPKFTRIKPEIAYDEIQHTVRLFTKAVLNIVSARSLSKNLKKSIIFLFNILVGCIKDKLPEWEKNILKDEEKIISESKKYTKLGKFHKELFTNPFELIELFKAIFKNDYKKHLKSIKNLSFDDMVEYLGKNLDD